MGALTYFCKFLHFYNKKKLKGVKLDVYLGKDLS